ncbi:phosphatidylinositol-binding protein scs2 [Lunasporangiospora selenospora]|uniref:Phosphatidylinositol-binding protein scs2 n=1 Tax=Lunasporangiospora selenospora TaxID=979761 RepID=A0A9P6KIX3_9FUNG|nr:phosphatidylinositol-binding protein scs2 [Lunasporangiospora selenospora]
MSIELSPPSQLAFRRPLTEPIRETLLITNPTQLPIAFKVKTTAPRQYCVRPNSGRVEPGQELEVQIQMQAMREDPPTDYKCKDKFLVQSIAITAERESLSLTDLWPAVERDAKDQICEKKIRCAFLPPIGSNESQDDEDNISRLPLATQSTHSTINTVPAPPSPTASFASEVQSGMAAITQVSQTQPSIVSTGSDTHNLRRELQAAQETIHTLQTSIEKLQGEATTLRQRKPEAGMSSAPVSTAVHMKSQQEGYPITIVAAAALISFIFAYLLF